jgi:hypothetical protein
MYIKFKLDRLMAQESVVEETAELPDESTDQEIRLELFDWSEEYISLSYDKLPKGTEVCTNCGNILTQKSKDDDECAHCGWWVTSEGE